MRRSTVIHNNVALETSGDAYEQTTVRHTIRSAPSHPAHQRSTVRLSSPVPTKSPPSEFTRHMSNHGPLSNLPDALSRMSVSSGYSSDLAIAAGV